MFSSKTGIVNIICVVLTIVLFVCQCLPFWHYGEEGAEESASINGYVWFPYEHKDTEKYLKTVDEDHTVNSVVIMPVFQLLFGLLCILLTAFKTEKGWVGIFPAASGILGIWGYLTNPAFQAGSIWPLHLCLSIALLLAALVNLVSMKKSSAQA